MARVLMQTVSGVPFGADWARAAAHGADVETFLLGSDSTGVTAPRPASPDDAGAPHRIAAPKLKPDRLLARLSDRRTASAFVGYVTDLQRRTGPVDVVHAHFYSGARALPAACARLGVPLVVTEHSTRLTGQSAAHKPFTARNRRTAARVYAGAARVIAVSDHLRECIETAGLATGVVTIPNPVSVPTLPRAVDPTDIVSVGRLEADKRPDLLLEAFSRLAPSHPELRLVLIGTGPLRSEVEQRVAQPDLAGRVEVLGRVDRTVVLERLAAARCFALASSVETFCIAAAEAVLAGVPVVMPRLSPVEDVVGTYGALVDDPDPASFAAALAAVCDAPPDTWPEAVRVERRHRFAPATVGAELARTYAAVGAGA